MLDGSEDLHLPSLHLDSADSAKTKIDKVDPLILGKVVVQPPAIHGDRPAHPMHLWEDLLSEYSVSSSAEDAELEPGG